MKQKESLHPDFKYSKYINAPMNIGGVGMMNFMNDKGIDAMDYGEDVQVTTELIESADGARFKVRIIRPCLVEVDNQVMLPCIVHYHGGGFLIKASPLLMKNLIDYAIRLGCIVVMVDYRLGRRHPFPKGFEDAYKALEWVRDNADDLNIDKDRIAIAGDSAGGALAAGVAIRARDEAGPKICFQLLLYPVMDHTQKQASIELYKDAPIWNQRKNKKMWQLYFREGIPDQIGYASPPLNAKSHQGLPPAYIEVAEYDCLRDEGIAYGRALQNCGVDAQVHCLDRAVHGYDNFLNSAYVDTFVDRRIEVLKLIFGKADIGMSIDDVDSGIEQEGVRDRGGGQVGDVNG